MGLHVSEQNKIQKTRLGQCTVLRAINGLQFVSKTLLFKKFKTLHSSRNFVDMQFNYRQWCRGYVKLILGQAYSENSNIRISLDSENQLHIALR